MFKADERGHSLLPACIECTRCFIIISASHESGSVTLHDRLLRAWRSWELHLNLHHQQGMCVPADTQLPFSQVLCVRTTTDWTWMHTSRSPHVKNACRWSTWPIHDLVIVNHNKLAHTYMNKAPVSTPLDTLCHKCHSILTQYACAWHTRTEVTKSFSPASASCCRCTAIHIAYHPSLDLHNL